MKKMGLFICIIAFALFICSSCSFNGGKYYEKGMTNLEMKKYEEAEANFKQAIEQGYSKNKINVIYTIINSYNDAKKAYDSKEYDEAKEYLDKIPNSYTDYIISHDIDSLKSDMEKYNQSVEILTKAKALYEQGKYSDASAMVLLVDTENISENQLTELDKLKSDITLKRKNEDYVYISKLNKLVEDYMNGLCQAVNNNDFRPLKSSLYEGSSIYNTQKKYVANVGQKDIYEYVNDFSISNIDWVSETECKISTIETYGIYTNGEYRIQSFKFKYDVIETKDKQLYLTTIESA